MGVLELAAQQEQIWVFGNHARLDFSPGVPLVGLPTAIEGFGEANASVCDAAGQLLFYTEGSYIWDKEGNLMPNGSDLTGFPWYMNVISPTSSTAQGTIIIPIPDDAQKYYVFSLTSHELQQNAGRLYYSIVDMTQNGGLGAVLSTQKGILVDTGFTESMTATLGDQCNIWLLTRTRNGQTFMAYEITFAGISAEPVLSIVGDSIGPNDPGFHIDVSPNRRRFSTGKTLYDFDPLSGMITNPVALLPNPATNDTLAYGVCFSPDNSRIYVNAISPTNVSRIYQFDLEAISPSAINASATYLGHPLSITDLKRTPDGKIYFFTNGGDLGNTPITTLGSIDMPNTLGTACNYVANAFQLNLTSAGIFGLPNVVPAFKRDTLTQYQSINTPCFSAGLTLHTDPEGRDFVWNDGSTDSILPVTIPGTYFVQYYTPSCSFHRDTFHITIPSLLPATGFQAPVCKYDHNGLAWVQPALNDTNTYTYTWRNEQGAVLQSHTHAFTADTLFDLSHGYYQVLMENQNGCDTVFEFNMPLPSYQVSFTSDTLLCMGDELPFQNTSTAAAFSSYHWLFGDGEGSEMEQPQHQYLHAGQYEVLLIGATNDPCYDTARRTITVDSMFTAAFYMDRSEICMGASIDFQLPDAAVTFTGLQWGWGDGSYLSAAYENGFSHAFDRSGVWPVQLSLNARVCPDAFFTDTVRVYALPEVNLGGDTSLCLDGHAVVLGNLVAAPDEPHHYLWNTGDTTAGLRVLQPGTYSLQIKTEPLGCTTTDEIEVSRDCYTDIPNAFTPNGDGDNDYFFPRTQLSQSISKLKMQVFSRWGQLVFETTRIDGRGWDGRFNDQEQPMGVYVYVIEAAYGNGRQERYEGNVTLIR